jgi:hypothetical protein
MFNETLKEKLERQRAINLENAYHVRDLLSDCVLQICRRLRRNPQYMTRRVK